jgi:wyosine [tRNA(Phe)-imidazoG37] synthetase (radical SAM superfamily)
VLTNSTTLHDPAVRRDLQEADVVLPSLDTLVPEEYRKLNRPAPGLGPDVLAQGLLALRREFAGEIFLEVLLASGLNDSEENLERIAAFCEQLGPDRVDVETMTRPGTSQEARPVDPGTLQRWRRALGAKVKPGPQKAGAESAGAHAPEDLEGMVLASVARRPQSAGQLARALDASREAVQQALDRLQARGDVAATAQGETTFYRAAFEA